MEIISGEKQLLNNNFYKQINNDSRKPTDNSQIKIFSEAFPRNKRDFITSFSEVHRMVEIGKIKIEIDSVEYRKLNYLDISQLMKLYKEWFPVKYSKNYFDNIFKNIDQGRGIAIGAFYKIEGENFIIGAILSEFKDDFEILNSVNKEILSRMCIAKFLNPMEYAYISTLGVCDEFRRFGLGTKLLNNLLSELSLRKCCFAVYLHVIEHNEIALKFYFNNNFDEVNKINNYYCIDDIFYHAKVLIKVFYSNVEQFKNSNYSYKDYISLILKKFKYILCCCCT